jgi:hypothetical protein
MSRAESRQLRQCADCLMDTFDTAEDYWVTDEIWLLAWSNRPSIAPLGFELPETGRGRVLCIACLEQRIGRTLNRDDFPNVAVNYQSRYRRSQRVLDRMTRPGKEDAS